MHEGFFGADQEFIVLYFLALGVTAFPSTLVGLAIILLQGHTTDFSSSNPRLAFVSSPESRGTLNLITACLSTIFTCVYVSVHVDVPDSSKVHRFLQGLHTGRGWVRKIPSVLLKCFSYACLLTTKPLFRRILWMLFNAFAPELVVFIAVMERISAKDGVKFMQSRGQEKWSMKLAFFADMGGFELEDGTYFSSGRDFLEWFDGVWSKDPDITVDVARIEDEIDDRSKADIVLKLWTVMQAVWLLVQTVVRLVERKAISELEVTTCAFILCAVVIYGCWLHKPYNVNKRVVLRDNMLKTRQSECNRRLSEASTSTLGTAIDASRFHLELPVFNSGSLDWLDAASDASSSPSPHSGVPSPTQPLHPFDATDESTPDADNEPTEGKVQSEAASIPCGIPIMLYANARYTPLNRAFLRPDWAWPSECLKFEVSQWRANFHVVACDVAGMVGILVGLIHAIPLWNALFINTTGQWLWRSCCIAQGVITLCVASIAFIEKRFNVGRPLFFATMFMAFLYCIARTGLFALIGLSFWSLPASVYTDTNWSWAYFPHWH